MLPDNRFTEIEINDLKEFYLMIMQNQNFRRDPLFYIQTSKLPVFRYLDNLSAPDRSRFNRTMFAVSRWNVFDNCSLCLSIVLITMYTLCGKARLTVDGIYGLLSAILEALRIILNPENDITAKILLFLETINHKFSPYTLARIICTELGKCNDQQRQFNIYYNI